MSHLGDTDGGSCCGRAVDVWTSLAAPLLPGDVLTNSICEHLALSMTALAAVGEVNAPSDLVDDAVTLR